MNERLEQLKRLAEAATPGPWHVGFHNEIADNLRVGNWQHELVRYRVVNVCASGSGEHLAFAKSQDLANFIAAANPSAILDIIRQLEEAQQEIARANAACEMANIAWDQSHEQLSAAQARIAELEAQVEPVATVGYKGMRTHSMLEVVFADGICPPAGTKLYLHAPQAVPEKIHADALSDFYGLIEAKEEIARLRCAAELVIDIAVEAYGWYKETTECTHLEVQEACETFRLNLQNRAAAPSPEGGAA